MIRYSNDTRNDLREILDYTIDRWGVDQADRYLDALIERFEQIEKMPGQGRACSEIHPALYMVEQGKHVIFYLPEVTGVFICRVLHTLMLAEYEDFLLSFSEAVEG